MTFNYVSLFSGIGGFEQALNKLGGTCVMASEIDKYANQSYEILYGHPTVGDVTKIAPEDVPDHDLLVGGFPCQAFSVAGKRLGFDDTRGTLFFEIARIAKVKRPKALLLENVKGLISHDKGKTLDTIIQTLADIGYTVDFNVLNSKYFGVPQNRERIFIIAVRDDLIEHQPWQIEGSNVVAKGKKRISEIEGVKTFNFDWPAQEEVTTRLRDILEDNVDEKYYLSEEKTAKLVAKLRGREIEVLEKREDKDINAICSPEIVTKNQNGTRIKSNDEPMSALTVKDRHGIIEGLPIREATKRGINQGVVEPQMLGAEEVSVKSIGNTNPSGSGMNGQVYDIDAGLAPTLTTNKGEGNRITSAPHYRIRKLTPRECFRLQGFPDSEFDKLVEGGISNSQLYKQAGNAVTVNVISAIGKRLITYLN
ncbi:Modification methylase Rho11sI [Niallia circulans]|uniref:DNA (cytosine-5-)-methyltransferase n=1 Tax=Niallia circulans TaxID=1397 RepID=UPI00077C5E8E|nr:DNA (cytosine-5-)-methyltransferase [Niallia circulans]MDR4318696.1 DNA (cytosine-5-)-methyltransferase [Niallia circulans]MED3839343.1 DNA (cytosine-5-)-methyltransferase [Niallia circulans]MED4245326.1 DNA (cytosine-5-)-methyltransferase [Niallia circulans]MED4250861.1 DNA (cytosine-5-)-methyltransferase [Niallia circulans]QKH60142.1 DNA (cytosine-5-)-methyltransferase [Niallia circulans]